MVFFTMQNGLITINTSDNSSTFIQHKNTTLNRNHISSFTINTYTYSIGYGIHIEMKNKTTHKFMFNEIIELERFARKIYPDFKYWGEGGEGGSNDE